MLIKTLFSIVKISKKEKKVSFSFALDKTRSHLQFAVHDVSISNLGKGLSSYSELFPPSYECVTCPVTDLSLQFTLLFTCVLSDLFLLIGVKGKKAVFKIKALLWKDIKREIQTHCFHSGFSDHRNLL